MTDHYREAERLLREHQVGVDAAVIVHALLATIQNQRWLNGYDLDETPIGLVTEQPKENYL